MSITLNEKICLSVSRRRLCPKERGDLLEKERGRPAESSSQDAQIRTLLDRQKERILAECQTEINRHEFQADYDRRSLRKLGDIVESQQEELHRAQAEELHRRDQQLLHEQLLKQSWNLREAHEKSLNEMELKKFQGSTFDTIARRRLVEDRDTILETHWQDTGIAFLITNSLQLMQRKSAEFYEKNYGVSNRIFVKVINKILQK